MQKNQALLSFTRWWSVNTRLFKGKVEDIIFSILFPLLADVFKEFSLFCLVFFRELVDLRLAELRGIDRDIRLSLSNGGTSSTSKKISENQKAKTNSNI